MWQISVLGILCFVALINGQSGSNIPIEPPTSTESTSSTSTSPATTSASTSTPSTPTASPTTPATTVSPSDVPVRGHYEVKDNANNTCLIAELAAEISVSINSEMFEIVLPSTMYAGLSTCSNDSDHLILTATDVKNKNASDSYNISLTLPFIKDNNTNYYSIVNLTFYAESDGKVNFNLTSNETVFTTPVSKSYHCAKKQDIKMSDNSNNSTVAALNFTFIQFEAFVTKNNTNFGPAVDCQSSLSPDIVPIAVGCALVGLIAVVMIAYLVGRRRSQARGYLSM